MAAQQVHPLGAGGLPRLQPRPIQWWPSVSSQLDQLLTLPGNWDSYGACPIDREIVESVKGLLACLGEFLDLPSPCVSATRTGGVLLQWRSGTKEVEVELVSRDAASFVYADEATTEEDEGELFRDECVDLNPVFKHLERLC